MTLRSLASLGVAAAMLVGACGSGGGDIVEANISPDDLTLGIGVNTCNADLTTTVEESDTEVIVTIEAANNTNDDCRDSVTVHLDAPFGDRILIDGSTGDEVEVGKNT